MESGLDRIEHERDAFPLRSKHLRQFSRHRHRVGNGDVDGAQVNEQSAQQRREPVRVALQLVGPAAHRAHFPVNDVRDFRVHAADVPADDA